MKDIKSLFLTARSSGRNSDISSYQEAVNELLETSPNDYILQLEYIISSSIGLSTFKEFVEKYGLPIACYDDVMACMEKCIKKCNDGGKDDSAYKEAVVWLESYRNKYTDCFAMFEYYCDSLPTDYVSTYYGVNKNGVQNRKLAAGMINKFGEAAIPDMLIVAEEIGSNAVNAVLEYVYDDERFDNPILYEWVLAATKDHVQMESSEYLRLMNESTASTIVKSMRERNHQIFREATIMGNDDAVYEYSEEEIEAIRDLISFKEYQLTGLDDPAAIMEAQNEIYSLYEELDGLIPEDGNIEDILESTSSAPKEAVKKVTANIKKLCKNIQKRIRPNIKDRTRGASFGARMSNTSVYAWPGNQNSIFKYGLFALKGKVRQYIEDRGYTGTEGYLEDIWIHLCIEVQISIRPTNDVKKMIRDIVESSVNDGIKPLIDNGTIDVDTKNISELRPGNQSIANQFTHMREYTDVVTIYFLNWDIPIRISKKYAFTGVDKSMFEATETVMKTEDAADSVIQMLPGSHNPDTITEAPWIMNTRDKKTSQTPTYIARNHDMATYGEEDPDKKSDDKDDKKIDDYRRPSADANDRDDNTGSSIDDGETDDTNKNDKDGTGKVPAGVQNYYYYTYNNSLNKHTSHDDHSNHVDDHSTGKTVNNIRGNGNQNSRPISKKNDDGDGFRSLESGKPWELNIGSPEFITEGLLDRLKSGAKYVMKKIRCFVGVKKTLANLQNMDRPDIINRTMPMTIIGTNIPIQQGVAVKNENGSDESTTDDLEYLISEGYYITEDAEFPGLSKNDVKNIVNRLRYKFNAEILFVHNESPLATAIGPASVVETTRETINRIVSGKKIDEVPGILTGYTGKMDKVILVNPKVISALGVRTASEVEMIISHEYGHVLTYDQLTQKDWLEYNVKRSMIASIAGIIKNLGMCKNAMAEANIFYYKLKPEALANKVAGLDPHVLTYSFLHVKTTGKLPGIDIDAIVNLKFPEFIMEQGGRASRGENVPVPELVKNLEFSKDLYSRITSDKALLSAIINPIEGLISMCKRHGGTFNESIAIDEAVGDADGKPESDHPIKDTFMDIDRKTAKYQQKAKQTVQNVQNAGRAAMKPVNRAKDWIGNLIARFKDADETKIKENLADPHVRSGVYNAIRKSIQVGALYKAGLLLNPIFAFLAITHKIGKNKKEFRIRNEMIGELKAELKIVQAKIEDADRKGDNKAKYQLMRLENELNKKLLRVGGGKGWSKII